MEFEWYNKPVRIGNVAPAYPAPTYIVGIDEIDEQAFIVAANKKRRKALMANKEGVPLALLDWDFTGCPEGREYACWAYEYARDFVKQNYVLSRPVPRYSAIAERLARVGRQLSAARTMTWRAAWMADQEQPNAKEAARPAH